MRRVAGRLAPDRSVDPAANREEVRAQTEQTRLPLDRPRGIEDGAAPRAVLPTSVQQPTGALDAEQRFEDQPGSPHFGGELVGVVEKDPLAVRALGRDS